MTESKFETVSSLVDNYQLDNETFNEVINDEDMSDTWQRYHLIGDVMRKESVDSLDFDLSSKISDAIMQEPTVLAPSNNKNSKTLLSELKNKVIQFAKPFGQVAIAASAAGLMVLGVQQNNLAENDILSPNQVIQTNPFGGIAEPVSFNYQQNNRMTQKQAFVQQQRRFQALLSDHQQQVKFNQHNDASKAQETEQVEELPK